MSNRFVVIVISITGLILLALILRNGYILALAIPFLVTLMVGLISLPYKIDLTAVRKVDGAIFTPTQPVRVKLSIQNHGGAIKRLAIEDETFMGSEILDGRFSMLRSVRGGESFELEYSMRLPRGSYAWNNLRAVVGDPLGIFNRVLELSAASEVTVLPATPGIRRQRLHPRLTRHFPGQIPADAPGQGTEFLGVREYRPGDALRHINWRSNARHPQTLFTNEFRQEEMADFGIILDTRGLGQFAEVDSKALESSINGAAAFAEKVIHEGNRVSLLVFGKGMSSLFPGSGKRQLALVLRELASVRSSPFISLDFLQYAPVRLFPTRSTLVVFGLLDDRDVEIYARLRSFGYDIVLVNKDLIVQNRKKFSSNGLHLAAARAARIERVLMVRKLTRLGVRVVDWQPGQDVASVLLEIGKQFSNLRKLVTR